MGSGSKFDSALSTQGGRANVVTNMDIGCGEPLAKDILSEMEEEGTKFTKEKIVFAARLENGNHIFLETGNSKNGLGHIVDGHADDFDRAFGVKPNQIGPFLRDTVAKGKLVTSFRYDTNGREGYRSVYYWKGNYVVVYAISANGYITTAMPGHPADYE